MHCPGTLILDKVISANSCFDDLQYTLLKTDWTDYIDPISVIYGKRLTAFYLGPSGRSCL